MKLTPISLIFLKIVVMGLVGIPFAYLFDRTAYNLRFMKYLADERFIWTSFLFTVYAFLVMAALYYILGLKRMVGGYIRREVSPLSTRLYRILWLITFGLALACFAYVFIQAGARHPAFQALKADYVGIKVLRQEIGNLINPSVYNLGFKFFLPVSLIISLFFIKNKTLIILSALLFILMSTFALEKGQIVSTIFLIIFFRMLVSEIPFRKLLGYGSLALVLISFMYFLTRFATDFKTLVSGISGRILYGQISDLPLYFRLFAEDRVSWTALLPPYITNLAGIGGVRSASRVVAEHIDPQGIIQGTAGVANSFFVGEAYAFAGMAGVLLSPFIVMANLAFFVWLFSGLKKNIVFIFLYAWFLYKIFDGIFGGISYFTFSGLHILLVIVIYYLLSYALVRLVKKLYRAQ